MRAESRNLTAVRDNRVPDFPVSNAALRCTITDLLMARGAIDATSLLVHGQSEPEQVDFENGETIWRISLLVPSRHYCGVAPNLLDHVRDQILGAAQESIRAFHGHCIRTVSISPESVPVDGWEHRTRAWLKLQATSNQGRIRSDSIAQVQVDGLLFRSRCEANAFQALVDNGQTVLPLPAVVSGSPQLRRFEPDFILIRRFGPIVLEIDGSPFHNKSKEEEERRLEPLTKNGIKVRRIDADRVSTPWAARQAIQTLLAELDLEDEICPF
jgi:hypothetical protein